MAEAVTQEVMQKKEGKVGMTTLTFRSKQYTFPSLIVKPDAQPGVPTPDAENICVLLDVGLFCPFCTGTFTAKFVRSHGRLALNKQGNFELTGEQAVSGEMHPGQLVLAPEHSDHACCSQHGNTQPTSEDSNRDSGDFGLRQNVEKEFNESGIHVHITPQPSSEQPKYARIVPLSSQHSHGHQPQLQQRSHHHHSHSHGHSHSQHHRHHHNRGPHSAREARHHDHSKHREQDPLVLERQKLMKQNLKQQHRERQMQIRQQQSRYLQSLENNQQRMTQLKAGQVYVEQKSSQYVIKHDLSKKHKRVPPPPPPKHSMKHSSPQPESKQSRAKDGSPAKVRKQYEQPQYTPEQRKRRGSSVDRQEIIYEGENIAHGGCIETNMDDFSQIVTSREIPGQIRTPPIKPRKQSSKDYSSPEARSPTRVDPYRVIAKRKRKGHTSTERQHDENQNVVHRPTEALSVERPDTKHESLEQLTPTRTSQHAPWASDNDIYRQPLPVNRLAKQTPPKVPPRIRKPEQQQLPVPPPRPPQRAGSETRSVTSEEGRSSIRSRSSASEAEQENWIKISKVSRGSRAPETLGPVVEPARNVSQEVSKKNSSMHEQIRSHTDERIINYIGEQAAIHNFAPEQVQEVSVAKSPSLSQKDYRGGRASPSTSANHSVGSSSHDHERSELNVTSDTVFNEIRKLSSQEGDDSDTTSEEADDVFNPEDALDEILESTETETYSPSSTLSRAFTGPRGKKKKKKPVEELQKPLEVPDEEAELHEAVTQIVEMELRTPSPETVLDEILEGVDDEVTRPDTPEWDIKHSKTTTASMNTRTMTTYTSELLQQTVVAHDRDSQPRSDSSESPARETLESTLTALNAKQAAKLSSPSTSCECLPEDGADNLSVGKLTYDGTSENSENDDARDSESPVSKKKPGSDTSIEKIIDRTLFLTDKILAAYPEIEQNEQTDRNDSTLASVATQSSLSDYEEVSGTEDSQDDAEIEDVVSEEVDKAIEEESRKKINIDYQFHGAYDELNQYMKRSEGNEASLLKETFDSQLSVKTESDFIDADFHSSKVYSPPSPQISGPMSIDYGGNIAVGNDRQDEASSEPTPVMEDPRAQGLALERVTQDLYDIQHSLASEGETWLIEDFYEDTEFAELESMSSDQGTMEKKRLSRHLAEIAKEEASAEGQRQQPEMSGESDNDATGVPRKVQFWVPHRERGAETEEEDEQKELETFEEVEERLREMEQTVKELGTLDSLDAPSDLDQEALSKEDLREVDDDQYNSEHTTEDLDQLESSCNEDIGSEIDDVIEALMMDEQFGDDIAKIVESGTDSYVNEDLGKSSYDHDKKLGPLRYVSPISTSGSESESEVEPKAISAHECDDRVPEVTIPNAEAQFLMQDVVKADSKQRSEVCITYVNIDGSSSDSITDPFVDESDESVIFVNKSSVAGSFDSIRLADVEEEIKEQAPEEKVTHTSKSVNLDIDHEPEVPKNEVEKKKEPTKRVITPTVVVDKSSESSSESSDESEADSTKEFEKIYTSYAQSEQFEIQTSVLPSQDELEQEYLGTHAAVPVSEALRRKMQEKKEKEAELGTQEVKEVCKKEEDQNKVLVTQPDENEDLIGWSPDSDEKPPKNESETNAEKVKGDENGASTVISCSDPQQMGSGTVAVSSTKSEQVVAQSTNVATFETEEVLSKQQAQEFLKHMFGANHAGGHKKESEDLEACLTDVCQVVAESNEDYEVKEEEVSTQEITLIFAWPRNKQMPLKCYDEPFREIHLRRVTKIKDFGIEVVEGPTVTTIERPGVPEIEDTPSSAKNPTKLPTSDSIVVSQKRKETVTKRVIPPQENTALQSETGSYEEKESKVDKSEDEDDSSSCGRPLSRDVEEDLEELLGGISDVSESFDFGGEKFQHPDHRDASAQTEGLSPDHCTWSDDQSSLLDTDTDCTDEEACFSSTGEGEHSTHAHTSAQGSMSAYTQNLTGSTNQSLPAKTNSNMHKHNASTQTGGGYIASMLPQGYGINAHGSAAQVEFASASGSIEHTLVNKSSIISECTSIAAPSDKTNNSQSTSVTSSSRGGRTSHSNPTQNLSKSMCVDVIPSFQSSVPCSAGHAYIKSPTGFMKSQGLIGRCLQAREHGDQLLMVAMGDEILDIDQDELADRDPGFSILHMGQCCCARSPFFDRVTLMDQIDTNIYNCADVLELENELVKYSGTTVQLVTQGTLECVQPFPLVESAIWTASLEFGMASPNFEGFLHSSADSFEKACLKHPGDKVDVCAEESTIESECVVPEITEIGMNQSISETRDTKAYFAEVAYAGSESLASYEATTMNTVTDYGVAFQTEEIAAWMLNMVFLTMFTQHGKQRLEKEVTNIDLRPYNDMKTGIKYARPNCIPAETSVDSPRSGICPNFAAEVSTVASGCMCIKPSVGVCGYYVMSKPKFNLSLAVDILTCDIHDDSMGQSTGSIVDDSSFALVNDTSTDVHVTLQDVDQDVHRKTSDEPQDGQKHPKDTGDGKEGGGKKGGQGHNAQGGGSQSTRSSASGGLNSSFGSSAAGGGASGGSGGGGDDDPWERRPKRPHEQDQKQSSKKDKKSDSTDEESDEEDGYGTVVRANVVKGKEKKKGGAYSVEKVVQHISFKPIGMVENKAVEMEVSAPPEIVIPVVRMSAPMDESACRIDKSPVLMTKPPEYKTVSKVTKTSGHESSDVSSEMENFDFDEMVQKMWKPMEPLVPPTDFHPMTGKKETVVKRSMDYEYEHKSSDGTHVKEAWSTKEDGGNAPLQVKPQEPKYTERTSTEHHEQRLQQDLPPVVQHKVKMPRPEKKDEHVYATVKQTARMPQYAPKLETEITSTRDVNVSGERQQQKRTVTKETIVSSGRQFTAPDPEGILQSFRKRASHEDLTDVKKETDSSTDGYGRHHSMVEVQAHDANIPFMDDPSEPEQVRSNVISDTVTVTREVRGSQGTKEQRLSSSAGEYYHKAESHEKHMGRVDGYDQRGVVRSNSSDGIISGRPPLPPARRRPSDEDLLAEEDPMKLFPILQYLSKKEQEEFMRRVSTQEQQIKQAPYKPPVPPKPRNAAQMMEQQRYESRQFEHQYAASSAPIYQAQTSNTANSFDSIINCRPIQPIHKIAFCAQEGTEEAPLTNFGSIDIVASYDTMEDESSCYSDTTGYSDDEYLSRHSRSAGSMSDARSDHLSGTDDGVLKIYHDGQLVAQIRNERAQQATQMDLAGSASSGDKWLYNFPSHEGEQRHQDGTLASIDKRTLQTIPRLEKVSPVVKHESSKAFIDDSVPGQFSEEHYNSKVIQQDLGEQGKLTGMHASSFTHTKTGSWEENQNQGGLNMRLQGVQREKTREEVHTTKSRQVNTLQDKYENVVENLKQRILGYGRQQRSMQYPQDPYIEYPTSTIDTSTHGSRDSSITGASSMTGASSVSSLSTVSSDRRHQQGSQMQFPGGVRGEDGVLRVYYDEEIISDIKSTLHASVGTKMIDDGRVLRVYHEGDLVAEIWRRQDISSPEMHHMETVQEVSQQERTLSPSVQHTRHAQQYDVPAMKTEINRQNAFTSEKIYENDDRHSVTESVSVGSDTEDEYFFEEYTVEHKVPLYEDLPTTEFKPEDKVTNVFSYYKKKDGDEEVKPSKFQRQDSYVERMEKMRQEKEFKAAQAKQRMMRIEHIQPTVQTATIKQQDYTKPTSVTVTKPVTVHAPSQRLKPKPKPKAPPKYQQVKDSRTVYLKNRPLPEIPKDPDEMSVCSTSSWLTEDTESTITGRAIDDDTAEKYRQMYSLYLQQQQHKRTEEEQRRLETPTKTPPVPPPRKHKKIPPMQEYIEQKENVPISGAEAMMKDALRKIDDMYASLTRKKTLPKYARKKPVVQQQTQVDTKRMELIEEVKRHLNEIRSKSNRPMTPEYKAEITREIKRRIYESRISDMRTSTESPGQRWLLQNKKTKDFDEVSEADSTSSWCTVASGSTVASQVAPFGEVTVIVEPNKGTDPRRSRHKVTEASYHLHQAHTSDDDHTEKQYIRRTFPRQQVRRQELPPVQEYEDPRILQEMYRRQQLLENYHRQEQFQRNTQRRHNYHTISSHSRHYEQQHAESPYDMPQIEYRPPSPDPVYVEHVELQEIARHDVGQVREESPSPDPVYIEHVELQEFGRHNLNNKTGTLSNIRDNRTSWGGQPTARMLDTAGKSGSMPVLDDDLYDNMLKMLSGVAKQEEEPQVYDNLPGHEGETASPLSMSPSNEPDDVTRQKTEQYLQSAYKFINEGTYDFLQDPDATPKVQHRTHSYDALDTAEDVKSMRHEVQQRRRTVSQSEASEQETLPIRGGGVQRQAAMTEQRGGYGRDSTSTHGSFTQGSRSTAQTRSSYQSAHQGRSLSQDRLLDSGTATVPNRRIDYQVRSSSLPPGITSEQMKAESSNRMQQRSHQTSSQSMTLPQRGFQQSDVVVHREAEPRRQSSSVMQKSSQQRSSQTSSEQRTGYQQSSTRGSKSLTRPSVPPPPPKLSTIQQNLPLDTGLQKQQYKRTSRQQQFQLSRNEANQHRMDYERQMSAPPDGQRFYQQSGDQSSQIRSSSVDRLQHQQHQQQQQQQQHHQHQQRFSDNVQQQQFGHGVQQKQQLSAGEQQQEQQQRFSSSEQQQQRFRSSEKQQQQRFRSSEQQQQRFSSSEQQQQRFSGEQQRFSGEQQRFSGEQQQQRFSGEQQQQRFSTGASGTGPGAIHMRYERPHSAQDSYRGSMVSGQQSMRSRPASAGSSHSLPPSQRVITDRLVIEHPDALATRERSPSTSSCASSIPQVDLDALDQMLIEIGAEQHTMPEVSAEEDDGTYATIPAHSDYGSDRQTTYSAYHKSNKCAGVPLFPVTDVPPELKLQTHPRFQKKDKDEMLLRLEEVRQKAKTEKQSHEEVRLAYRSELKRFIKGREVGQDIYAKPISKSKRGKVQISQKVEQKQEPKGIELSEPQFTEKGPQPTHYQPLNIKIHPKITQTSDSLKKQPSLTMEELYPHEERQRRQIIYKPTIAQIHDHRKKMKPVLEAIKNTGATKSLKNALDQMQQKEQIQSQFDKAARFTEMYSKSSKSHLHKNSEQKRSAKHRTSMEFNTSYNQGRHRSSAQNIQKEDTFDPTSIDLFIDDDDGDYAQLRSGATIDSYRHDDQSDQMTQKHREQPSIPLVRVTPPMPSVPEPGRTTRSQPWTAKRTPTSLQSKGQHQAPLDTQLAAITEESSVSDSSLDYGRNEQKTKRKPLNECHYDNTLNMQLSKPHQQTSMVPSNVQRLSPSFRGDRQQSVSESSTQHSYQSSVIGSDSGKSVQSVLNSDIVPFPQQNVGQGVHRSHPDSVNDIVSDMEDYYTTRANEGLGSSLVPSTFAHAGNSDGECVAVSSVQSVSHLPMACLKPPDDTSNITTESSEDSSSEIYMWCPPGARQGIVIKGFIREQICYKYFDACVEQDFIDSSVELDGTLIDMHPVMACSNSRSYVTPIRLRLSRHIPGLPSQHYVPKLQIEVVIDVIENEDLEVVSAFEGCVSALVCKASFGAIALDRLSLGMVEGVVDNSKANSINDDSLDYQSIEPKIVGYGNDDSGLDTETSIESEFQRDIDVTADYCSSAPKAVEHSLISQEPKDSGLDTETSIDSEVPTGIDSSVCMSSTETPKEESLLYAAPSTESPVEEDINSSTCSSISGAKGENFVAQEIKEIGVDINTLDDSNLQKDGNESVCPSVSKATENILAPQEMREHTVNEDAELTETAPKFSGRPTIIQSDGRQFPSSTPQLDLNILKESAICQSHSLDSESNNHTETLSPEEEHCETQSVEEAKSALYSYSSESAISEMSSEDEHQMSSSKSDSDSEYSECMFRRMPIKGRSSSDPTLSDADRYYIDYMSHMRNQKREAGRQRTSSDPQQEGGEHTIADIYCTSTSSSNDDFPSVSDMYQRIMTLTRNIDATIEDVINGSHAVDRDEEGPGQASSDRLVEVTTDPEGLELSEISDYSITNKDLDEKENAQEDGPDSIEMYVVGIIERAHTAAITEIELVDLEEGSSTDSGKSHDTQNNSDDLDMSETDMINTTSSCIVAEQVIDNAHEEGVSKAPFCSNENCENGEITEVQESETGNLLQCLTESTLSGESIGIQEEKNCIAEDIKQTISEPIGVDSGSALAEGNKQPPEPQSEPIALSGKTCQKVSSKEDTSVSDIIAAYGAQSVGSRPTEADTSSSVPEPQTPKSSSSDESLISNLLDSYSLVSMEENAELSGDSAHTVIEKPKVSSTERRDGRKEMTDYMTIGSDIMQEMQAGKSTKYQVLTDKYQEYLDRGLELIHTDNIDEPFSISNVFEVSDTASESSSSTSSTKSASSWGSQDTVIENPAFSVQYVKGVALQKIDMKTFQSKKPETKSTLSPSTTVPTSAKVEQVLNTNVNAVKKSTSCCAITMDHSRSQIEEEHAETNLEREFDNQSGLRAQIGLGPNPDTVQQLNEKDDSIDNFNESILSGTETKQSGDQTSTNVNEGISEEDLGVSKSNTSTRPLESTLRTLDGGATGTEVIEKLDEDISMKELSSGEGCPKTQADECIPHDDSEHAYSGEVEGTSSSENEKTNLPFRASHIDCYVQDYEVRGPEFDISDIKLSEAVHTELTSNNDDSRTNIRYSEQTELLASRASAERETLVIASPADVVVVKDLLAEMVSLTVNSVDGTSCIGASEIQELSNREISLDRTMIESVIPEKENCESCPDLTPMIESEVDPHTREIIRNIECDSKNTVVTECESEQTDVDTSLAPCATQADTLGDSTDYIDCHIDKEIIDIMEEIITEIVNSIKGWGENKGETEIAMGSCIDENPNMQLASPELCPEMNEIQTIEGSHAELLPESIPLEGNVPSTDTRESFKGLAEGDFVESSDFEVWSNYHTSQNVNSSTQREEKDYDIFSGDITTGGTRQVTGLESIFESETVEDKEKHMELLDATTDPDSNTDSTIIRNLLTDMVTGIVNLVEAQHGNLNQMSRDQLVSLIQERQSIAYELCLEDVLESGSMDNAQDSDSLEDSVTQSSVSQSDLSCTDDIFRESFSEKPRTGSRGDSEELHTTEDTLSVSIDSTHTDQSTRADSLESIPTKRPLSDLIIFSDSDHSSTTNLKLFSDSQPERRKQGVRHTFLMQYSDSSDQDSIDFKTQPSLKLEKSESSGDEVGSLRPFLTNIANIDRTSTSQDSQYSSEARATSPKHVESQKTGIGALPRDQTEMFDKLKTMTQGFDDILGQAKRMKDDFASTRQKVSADLTRPKEHSDANTKTIAHMKECTDQMTNYPSSGGQPDIGIDSASDALEGAVGGSVHRLREPLPVTGRNRSLSLPVPELEEIDSGDSTDAEDSDDPTDHSSNQPKSPRERRRNKIRPTLSANNSPASRRHRAIRRRFWRR